MLVKPFAGVTLATACAFGCDMSVTAASMGKSRLYVSPTDSIGLSCRYSGSFHALKANEQYFAASQALSCLATHHPVTNVTCNVTVATAGCGLLKHFSIFSRLSILHSCFSPCQGTQ